MNAAVPEPASADAIENPLELATVTLPVEAMTCASRVARVERALGKAEDAASVNLASEQARVEGLAGVMDATAIVDWVDWAGADVLAGAAANRLSAPTRSR